MKISRTLNIIRGGLFTALGLVFMYIAFLIPINSLFFGAAASAVIPICIMVSGTRYGLLVYISTALLSILLLGLRTITISYIIFFGLYGIIKYYIERLRRVSYEILLKLIFFNAALTLSFYLYRLLFLNIPSYKFPVWLILAALQFVFLIYDYALTIFIYLADKYLNKNA